MSSSSPTRLGTINYDLGTSLAATVNLADNDAPATIDLSSYVRVGRFALPEPTTITPPDGHSLLAQEASGVTYDWDTDTLFVVGDGGTSVVQVTKTGQLVDSMTLAPGGSPQGGDFYDPEGITYVGGGKFVMSEERDRQAVLFTYVAGTTLHRADTQTVKLGTFVPNIGTEGISYDPLTSGFIAIKETQPQGIFQTGIDFAAGTATNGSPTTANSIDLFDPALANLLDLADVFALSNLPFLNGQSQSGNLLILSQESGKIVNIDDTSVGSTPDATTSFTLNITQVVNPGTLIISEVAPWSSGSSPLAADWFEVTNSGTVAVNISGWKMDDNSNSFGASVALNGITNIAPGESVIFIETANLAGATTTVLSTWFGANPPVGLQIGSYSGGGVGRQFCRERDRRSLHRGDQPLQVEERHGHSRRRRPTRWPGQLASDGNLNATEDTAATGMLVATDIDSASLSFSLVDTSNAHGTVTITNATTGAYSYSPAADFHGAASFTFQANDGVLTSNAATVSIVVTPVNDKPTADAKSVTTGEDIPVSLTLSGSDVETPVGSLVFAITVQPQHGTLAVSGTQVVYTPAIGYHGTDNFRYTITAK